MVKMTKSHTLLNYHIKVVYYFTKSSFCTRSSSTHTLPYPTIPPPLKISLPQATTTLNTMPQDIGKLTYIHQIDVFLFHDEVQGQLDIFHPLCMHPWPLVVAPHFLLRENFQQQNQSQSIREVFCKLINKIFLTAKFLDVLIAPPGEGLFLDSLPLSINGCLRQNDCIFFLYHIFLVGPTETIDPVCMVSQCESVCQWIPTLASYVLLTSRNFRAREF